MIATGLLLVQSGNAMTLLIGYGVFISLLGNVAMNAPLRTCITSVRRRGTALALLGSGSSACCGGLSCILRAVIQCDVRSDGVL
jgi:hypothetical protein